MTIALTVLVGALAAGWFIPGLLGRMDLRRRDPLLMIVAWLVSAAGFLVAAGLSVLLLLLPDHGPLLAVLHRCWSAFQHGSPPRVEELAGLLGAGVLAVLATRLAIAAVRGGRQRARKRRAGLAVLRVATLSDAGQQDILWLAHERPLAFSMAGRPGVVVATEGLVRHLDHTAVEAVFAHERAHLTGRHHLLIAAAEALRAALPFVPLFRQVPQAIRDLVELSADVTAVRTCGAPAVRAALLGVARHGAPSTSLAMAQDAVELRLARLGHGSRPPRTTHRIVSCGLTGLTAATLPLLAGITLLVSIAFITCPLNG